MSCILGTAHIQVSTTAFSEDYFKHHILLLMGVAQVECEQFFSKIKLTDSDLSGEEFLQMAPLEAKVHKFSNHLGKPRVEAKPRVLGQLGMKGNKMKL